MVVNVNVNVKSLTQELAGRQAKAKNEAFATYKNLARLLADGAGKPSLSEVERILAAAGRSPQQLQDDVGKVALERRLRATVAAADAEAIRKSRVAMNVEYARLQEKLKAEMKAAQDSWEAAMWQIQHERDRLTDLELLAQDALGKLPSCEIT